MRLFVNVDHVATIRQARLATEPDPLAAALVAEAHGADGITFHLREDRRHIGDHDAEALVNGITTAANFELAARDDIVSLACRLRPHQATLVPERREELTTEGGLDLAGKLPELRESIDRLTDAGIRVSLFIDPELATIDRARQLGVAAIELHTGRYANAMAPAHAELEELARAARHAAGLGLAVHAGHGLTRGNVAPVAAIIPIEELNIGHSIIARSITIGIGPATREIRRLMDGARQ